MTLVQQLWQYLFLALFSLFFISPVQAQTLPLWELGVATGYVSIPYYRGSASSREVLVPMPLAIYRGNEHKPRPKERLFTPSFAVGLPVPEGGGSGVRQNMPRLNATLEFGPKLTKTLWQQPGQSLSFNAPLRAVSSLSPQHIEMQGWVFAPYVQYMVANKGRNGWSLNAAFGPQYGSQGFHQYYYGVDSIYATSARTAYNAEAGYGGSRLTVYAQKAFKRLWLSAFMRYDDLSGARFVDSPLVERRSSLFSGFVVGWVFAKSPQQIWVTQ